MQCRPCDVQPCLLPVHSQRQANAARYVWHTWLQSSGKIGVSARPKGVAAAWNADDYLTKENGRVHGVSF